MSSKNINNNNNEKTSTSNNTIPIIVHSEQTIISNSNDDTQLYVQKWSIPNPKAELLIIHGYLEHSNRYIEFAQYLCHNYNVNVTAYDIRGHGKSSGTKAYVDNFSKYHDDLESVLETLPSSSSSSTNGTSDDSVPRFLLCHSNGGLFTLDYMLKDESSNNYKNRKSIINSLSGVITTSPFLQPDNGISPIKKLIAKLLGGIFPTMFIPADVKVNDLTSCPTKQKEFLNDNVYLHYATIGWGKLVMELQSQIQEKVKKAKEAESSLKFPLPLLYIYGNKDKIAGPKTSQEMATTLLQKDKTIICRENEQHEVLNEINRVELYNIIGNWLIERST